MSQRAQTQIEKDSDTEPESPQSPFEDFNDFEQRLKKIKKMEYVKTNKSGNLGIGKTLEDLLGIPTNNIQGPDAAGKIEVKSTRKNSKNLTTLFCKEPPENFQYLWNKDLVEELGYVDKKGRKALRVKVKVDETNSKGFYLSVEDSSIKIKHSEYGTCGKYNLNLLKEIFEKKQPELCIVKADVGKRNGNEYFWYNEAYHLSDFNSEKFLELIKKSSISLGLRMHIKEDGSLENKGTAWRIKDLSKLEEVYQKRKEILTKDEKEQKSFEEYCINREKIEEEIDIIAKKVLRYLNKNGKSKITDIKKGVSEKKYLVGYRLEKLKELNLIELEYRERVNNVGEIRWSCLSKKGETAIEKGLTSNIDEEKKQQIPEESKINNIEEKVEKLETKIDEIIDNPNKKSTELEATKEEIRETRRLLEEWNEEKEKQLIGMKNMMEQKFNENIENYI